MAELRQTESAERSTALVGTQMRNIAVNSRSYVDLVKLVPGVVSTVDLRIAGTGGVQNIAANGQRFNSKKEARLKALWFARLANQMSELPPFDQVFREFRRALRQSDLP